MPSTSNPDALVVDALILEKLIEHLKQITPKVFLGYSASGLERPLLPAILLDLESISEDSRQGTKAKCSMRINISLVESTDAETTYRLLALNDAVRNLFAENNRPFPAVRKLSISETQFDISPNNSHFSFADMTLVLEVVK